MVICLTLGSISKAIFCPVPGPSTQAVFELPSKALSARESFRFWLFKRLLVGRGKLMNVSL